MKAVTDFAGLDPGPEESWMFPRLGAGVCNNDNLFIFTSVAVNKNGYPLHLAALDVYFRRLIAVRSKKTTWDHLLQAAADKLHKRDPENVFYEFLATGSSDSLATKLLSQVPADGNHEQIQWSTMRADAEKAWLHSMGWEFIFVIDNMLDDVY